MTHDLIRRIEKLGSPRVVVVGDLILDRYIWGYAERISQEAPVPLLRADQREHRLGGAASVATMVRTLGAQVRLIGGVGNDTEASLVRPILAEHEIDDRLVVSLDDRPTTLKERYIGRAQDRHPQQMIRVDYETRDPIPGIDEARLHAELPAVLEWADVVLDFRLRQRCLHADLCCARSSTPPAGQRVKVLADPIRSTDYGRYHGVHCMTPNRLEAQLATGLVDHVPRRCASVGKKLVESLAMEAVLVTLDRDGMALVRADGRAELVPTRPRQVYDITGAGDMVLAVVGLCIADGADYDEAAALGNVAGGLEVEKFGVALLDPRGDPARPGRPPSSATNRRARPRRLARRGSSPPPRRPEGRLHQRLLRPAASRPCAAAARGGRLGRFPGRRPELRRERSRA